MAGVTGMTEAVAAGFVMERAADVGISLEGLPGLFTVLEAALSALGDELVRQGMIPGAQQVHQMAWHVSAANVLAAEEDTVALARFLQS